MIASLARSVMRRACHHTLIFHRVVRNSDPMSPSEPTQAWFRQLMRMLAGNFEMISLEEALSRREAGRLNGRTISVTFDDGYADNYEVALPVLEEFKVPGTFFVASKFIDGGRMWNDSIIETFRRLPAGQCEVADEQPHVFDLGDWASRRDAADQMITAWKHLPPGQRQTRVDKFSRNVPDLPADLMLSKSQLRALADSPMATIGGHTRSHPILASLSDEQARREIEGGKDELEEWIQQDISLFAYPNGKAGRDFHAIHADIVREAGFSAAVTTDWGTLNASADCYLIPRFTPWQRNLDRFSLDLLRCHYGLI